MVMPRPMAIADVSGHKRKYVLKALQDELEPLMVHITTPARLVHYVGHIILVELRVFPCPFPSTGRIPFHIVSTLDETRFYFQPHQ